jgi:hypothetical protein
MHFMTQSSKVRASRSGDISIYLIPMVCLSYLCGLLMNDMVFDISTNDLATRSYYCELMKSFSNHFGRLRILLPGFMCGVCQVVIWFKASNSQIKVLQGWVIANFVLVGIPLIGVSLSLCDKACSTIENSDLWPHRSEVYTIHMVMLALFLSGLWCQSRILLSTLGSSE